MVPHYDNAEGGNHDTRFCYVGERRLRVLEQRLPERAFVLGVDSHTALLLDLDARTASVRGLGGVTVRVDGRSHAFPGGSEVAIDDLAEAAEGLRAGKSVASGPGASGARVEGAEPGGRVPARAAPLADEVAQLEGSFVDAIAGRDVGRAVEALLELDSVLEARVRAGEDSLELDNARSVFRSLIARLGEAATEGVRDPREQLDPFVAALLELRARAREARDYGSADLIRDRLTAAGIEVHDAAEGSTWELLRSAEAGERAVP